MGRRRGLRGAALAAGGVVIAGACTAFVVSRLLDEWSAARDSLATANPRWLALAVVLVVAAMVSMAAGWGRVLGALGVPAGIRASVQWFFVGEIAKYVPGGVWPIVGRAELARRGGVPRTVAYQSVAASLLFLYTAAGVVGVAFLATAVSETPTVPLLVGAACVVAAVTVLHPRVVVVLGDAVSRVAGRPLALPSLTWSTATRLIAGYLPTWILIGSATWAVARSLDPSAPFLVIALAAPAAWLVGFLAVPVPSGLGVREAAFVAATATALDPAVAILTAGIARLLFVATDATTAAASAPGARASRVAPRRDPAVEGSPISGRAARR